MMFIVSVKAQIKTSSWHDGYWGRWDTQYTYQIYGNYYEFVVYSSGDHPSEFIFRFHANVYQYPDKKDIKYHKKNDLWYEYSGTVEYYVTEKYPSILSILRAFQFPIFSYNSGNEGNPCAKRTANAVIKIAPYKEHPKCYNIYFDDIVVGIDLNTCYFPK